MIMKLKIFSLAAIFFVTLFACGCLANAENTTSKDNSAQINENVDAVKNNLSSAQSGGKFTKAEDIDPVEEILQSMSLTEKVGQMMIVGVHGTAVNDDIKYILNQYHYGGIIFFDRNMQSKAQVKSFVDELNAVANEKVPLFIALDEEGGRVSRMKEALEVMPSQQEIGNSGDPTYAYDTARQLSQNLREIGVNINFAPVADVGPDTRHFSTNTDVVTDFISYAAQGYDNEKFFYCLKHFPGIGKSKIDPHKDISEIDDDIDTLYVEELPPFKEVIDHHDHSNFMVMIGHLRYPALDPENPASISPAIITGLLRNELGFKGVIITDDLEMGATKDYHDNIGVNAIKAGVDIALVCHEYPSQEKVYLSILEAVQRGEISEERINESVRRILKMKLKLMNQ